MKTMAVDEFLKFGPCWGEERVRAFAGDKQEWSALDILRAKGVSDEDKLWATLREEFIDAPILHEFACRCAERALERVDHPDERSVNAIRVKRAWIKGEASDDELIAAQATARDAAWVAARVAAQATARDAAWDAARDAAWDAARVAARAAAWDAAWDKERAWQVAELIRMLEGESE